MKEKDKSNQKKKITINPSKPTFEKQKEKQKPENVSLCPSSRPQPHQEHTMSRNLPTEKSVEFGRVYEAECKPSDMSVYDNRQMKKYMTPDSHAAKCPRCGATIRQITKLLEEIKHLRFEKQLKCAHCEAFGVIKSCKKCGTLVRDFLTSGSSCRQEQYSKWVLQVKRVLTNILNSEMTCPYLDFTKKLPTNDELERLIQELRTPLGPQRQVKVRDLFDEDESNTDVASIIEKKLKDIQLGKSSEEDFSRPKIFEEEEDTYGDELIDQEKARRDLIKEAQDAKEKEMEKRSKVEYDKKQVDSTGKQEGASKVDDTGQADRIARAKRDSRGELADKDVGVGKSVSSKSKIAKGDLPQKEGVQKKGGKGHDEGAAKRESAEKKDRVGKKEGAIEKDRLEKGEGVRKRVIAGKGEGAEKRDMAGIREVAGKRDVAGKAEGARKKEVAGKVEGGVKKDVVGKTQVAGKKDVTGKETAAKKDVAGKADSAGKKDVMGKDEDASKKNIAGKGEASGKMASKDEGGGKKDVVGKTEVAGKKDVTGKETAGKKDVAGKTDSAGKKDVMGKDEDASKKKIAGKDEAPGKKDIAVKGESTEKKDASGKEKKDETEKGELAGKDSKFGKAEKEGKSEELKKADKTGKKDKPDTAPVKEKSDGGFGKIDKETEKQVQKSGKRKKSKEETKKEETDKEGAKKGKKDGDVDESQGKNQGKKKTEGDEKTGKGDGGDSKAKPEKGATKGPSVPIPKKVDDSPTANLLLAYIKQSKRESAQLPMIRKKPRESSIKVVKKPVVRKTQAPSLAPVEETSSNISTESGLHRRGSKRNFIHGIKLMIKGNKIVKITRPQKKKSEPSLIRVHTVTRITTKSSMPSTRLMPSKKPTSKEVSGKETYFKYQLSDPRFIENGYTKLPLNKTTRVMFSFKMIPTHLNRNWFDRHKGAGILYYDTGEKLAEIDEDGSGRWYYRNGVMALNYYKTEDDPNAFRYLLYSSGENDKNGRKRLTTILGSFDYEGNGIVFDHCGNVRLKYNQTEGEVIDSRIGPPGRWQWHMLNEPPVLDQIYVEKHGNLPINILGHKSKLVASKAVDTQIKDTRVDVEIENFLREKSKKTTSTFEACLIKDKTFQLNEAFALHIISQEHITLIFRNGLTCLKLELGMRLDSTEIMNMEMTDLNQTFTPYDCELKPSTESVAHIKRVIAETKNQTKQMKRHLNPCLNPDTAPHAYRPVVV